MKRGRTVAVVIPTYGRKGLLQQTLCHLESQERLPDEVIVSAPNEAHVEPYASARLKVSYVFGRQGLAAQRNQALERVLDRFDIVTFFDDDFLPACNYLRLLVDAFDRNQGWVVVMGNVVRDGATGAGLSFQEGLEALRAAEAAPSREVRIVKHPGAYGCNMSFRAAHVGEIRFDERLPLYGWQEDIDFSSQLRRSGDIIWLSTLVGVHLGTKSGRVSGLRFGYSQVVNPVYLIRKGTMGLDFGLKLIVRNFAANVVRSLRPEPYIDRRGRLRGNMIGLCHVLIGRVDPEHILKL
jgi:glycosyltransferase involved in cell wall biosynthesis